jgi:hypothetical protein
VLLIGQEGLRMDLGTWLRTQGDRLAAVLAGLAAVLALFAGWAGVSRTPYPAEQLPLILSGGVGAVILIGIAATLWLSADLRDEWRKLDLIEEALRDLTSTVIVDADALDGNGHAAATRTRTSASS